MTGRRITRELARAVVETEPEARHSSVELNGVAVIRTACDAIEVRANGSSLRVTLAEAWAIAAAVLELARSPATR